MGKERKHKPRFGGQQGVGACVELWMQVPESGNDGGVGQLSSQNASIKRIILCLRTAYLAAQRPTPGTNEWKLHTHLYTRQQELCIAMQKLVAQVSQPHPSGSMLLGRPTCTSTNRADHHIQQCSMRDCHKDVLYITS